jgi:hypothetical protein
VLSALCVAIASFSSTSGAARDFVSSTASFGELLKYGTSTSLAFTTSDCMKFLCEISSGTALMMFVSAEVSLASAIEVPMLMQLRGWRRRIVRH